MTELRLSYVNVEHGGRTAAGYSAYAGDGGPYDFNKVVGMLHDGDWPDILALGEGDRYELNGMEGALEAAAAMLEAGGPRYHPYPCSLPREGGLFAPVIFVGDKVVPRRFYNHRLPDFAGRNRNRMIFTLRGRTDPIQIRTWHGDIHSGEQRLADLREFARDAKPAMPCALLGDWNSVPSGPMWEPHDLNQPGLHQPVALAWRIQWDDSSDWAKPHRYDSRALDYLCGTWDPDTETRIGGVGFHHAAELAGDYTPTQIPRPNGRQPMAIDGILLNPPLASAYVPGSYTVHPFRDPDNPDSDHHRISVTLDI